MASRSREFKSGLRMGIDESAATDSSSRGRRTSAPCTGSLAGILEAFSSPRIALGRVKSSFCSVGRLRSVEELGLNGLRDVASSSAQHTFGTDGRSLASWLVSVVWTEEDVWLVRRKGRLRAKDAAMLLRMLLRKFLVKLVVFVFSLVERFDVAEADGLLGSFSSGVSAPSPAVGTSA